MDFSDYRKYQEAFDFFNQPCFFSKRKRTFLEYLCRTIPFHARVLDIGGGTGALTAELCRRRHDLALTIVEPAQSWIEAAQRRLPIQTEFFHSTIEDALPRLATYDFILMIRVLYLISRDYTTIKSLFKKLKPHLTHKGLLTIYEIQPNTFSTVQRGLRETALRHDLAREFERYWPFYEEYITRVSNQYSIPLIEPLTYHQILQDAGYEKILFENRIMVYKKKAKRRQTVLAEFYHFHDNQGIYLLNIERLSIFIINQQLAAALDILKNSGELPPRNSPLYNALERLELISDSKRSQSLPKIPFPTAHLILNISQTCNLACIYCYGDEGEYGKAGYLSTERAYQIIDWFIDNSGATNALAISFFGGEPLLNFPIIQKCVEYSQQKAKDRGKKISFGVTTNGTLLTHAIAKWLKNNKIQLNLSYDGYLQQQQRKYKNGSSSHPDLEKAIAILRDLYGANFKITTTLATDTADIDAIRREHYTIGCNRFQIRRASPVHTVDTENTEKYAQLNTILNSDEMLTALLDDIERQFSKIYLSIKNRNWQIENDFKKIFSILATKKKRHYYCGAGKGLLSVNTEGYVYPCHRFIGHPDYGMGIIENFDPAARDFYFSRQVDTILTCSTCWARYFCGGGCLYENMKGSDSIPTQSAFYCTIQKKTIETAIRLFASFNDEDKVFLRKTMKINYFEP